MFFHVNKNDYNKNVKSRVNQNPLNLMNISYPELVGVLCKRTTEYRFINFKPPENIKCNFSENNCVSS